MHPQDVSRTQFLQQLVTKNLVGSFILFPVILLDIEPGWEIVEQWPNRLVAKSMIKSVQTGLW